MQRQYIVENSFPCKKMLINTNGVVKSQYQLLLQILCLHNLQGQDADRFPLLYCFSQFLKTLQLFHFM